MTQKHFIELAAIIAGERANVDRCVSPTADRARYEQLRDLTRSVADMCARSNSRFKRDTFYRAAGFPELTDN